MYPEGPGCDEVIHFIPVDYVAKAVVYLSIEEQGQSLCKYFHYSRMHYIDFSSFILISSSCFSLGK